MMQRRAIHVRLHPELHSRLDAEMESQHLDKSAIVTTALNHYFAKLDADRKPRRQQG